jgi:hypothetical protein
MSSFDAIHTTDLNWIVCDSHRLKPNLEEPIKENKVERKINFINHIDVVSSQILLSRAMDAMLLWSPHE